MQQTRKRLQFRLNFMRNIHNGGVQCELCWSVSVVVVLSNNCGFVSSSEFSQLRYRQWYVHKRCQHFLQQNDILIYFMLTKIVSPLLAVVYGGNRRGSHRISLLDVKFHVVYFELSGKLKIGLPFDH